MPVQSIRAQDARSHLGELLNQVHYQNKQFQIQRKDKPMAWLVSGAFMQAAEQALAHLIAHDPALADMLAILLDDGLRAAIEAGMEESQAGERVPLASILD